MGLAVTGAVLHVAWPFLASSASAGAGWTSRAIAILAVALAATVMWHGRRRLTIALSSLPFAVTALAFILGTTVLGTFILQHAPPEEYAKRFGTALAPAIVRLGLNDVFHTVWFSGWLAMLAFSLVLVAIRRRAWRPARWGHGLAHLGVVLVLAGGFVGSHWGIRGTIDLHKGRSADAMTVSSKKESPEAIHPLGFSVLLEDFDVERHPPEYRLYVYERSGEDFRVVRSFRPGELADWKPAGATIRVVREYTDLRLRRELREAPHASGTPALVVETGPTEPIHLFAADPRRNAVDLASRNGPLLRFRWDPPADDEIARWAAPQPERHVLAASTKDGTGRTEEIPVAPGGKASILDGAWSVRILGYYPDFAYDAEERKASTRSDRPNNPALQVEVTPAAGGPGEKRWLFAKNPEFSHGGGAASAALLLTYRHEAARTPSPKEVLAIGKTAETWDLENGKVLKKASFAPEGGALPNFPGTKIRLFASAEEYFVPENASPEPRNPAVEVEMRRGEKSETYYLTAEHGKPLRLPDDKTFLAFELKPEDVKAFRSRLAILREGKKVAEKTISVNDPLSYGGYAFYQSNYRKEDPTYSGLLVVKDPGLPLAWTGMIMLCAGMIVIYYLRPRRRRDRATA